MRSILLIVALGCGTKASEVPREVTAADLERGKSLAGSLKKSLFGELATALGRGAPSAIEVCQTRAPAIATELSKDGVRVGRATRRARNSQNLATDWKLDAIAHFEALETRDQPLTSATFSRVLGDRIGYAEPLLIQEMCLTCHGKALAPDVAAALASRYPGDQATGYAAGDLRGVVWVELPGR
jgi:hypothetical protein